MDLKSKTEIYEFDLSNLEAELIVDIPAPKYTISIIFKDGVFQGVKNLFNLPYTNEEWDVLLIIYKQIQELKKSYLEENKTIVSESEVDDGYI